MVTQDVTMLDYEVTISKRDFVDLHEGSKGGVLANALTCCQKVIDHHHLGGIGLLLLEVF